MMKLIVAVRNFVNAPTAVFRIQYLRCSNDGDIRNSYYQIAVVPSLVHNLKSVFTTVEEFFDSAVTHVV
jgi:hypothetical protein